MNLDLDDRQKLFARCDPPEGVSVEDPAFADAHFNAYRLRCNWRLYPGGPHSKAPPKRVLDVIDKDYVLR